MSNQPSDLLNRAAYLKEPTLVTRQGKAVAVLVSVEGWGELVRLKRWRKVVKTAGQAEDSVERSAEAEKEGVEQ